jgi:hypothetical protein
MLDTQVAFSSAGTPSSSRFYCTIPEFDPKQFGHDVQVRSPPALSSFVAIVSVATELDGHFFEPLLPCIDIISYLITNSLKWQVNVGEDITVRDAYGPPPWYRQLAGPAYLYYRSATEMAALRAEGDRIHILLPEQLNTIHGAFVSFWAVCMKHELVVIFCRGSCNHTWSYRLVDSTQTCRHLELEQIFIQTLSILCPQVLLVLTNKVFTVLRQLKGDEETGKHLADQKPTPDQKPAQEPALEQKLTSFMFDHQFSSPSLSVNLTKSSLSLLSFLPRVDMGKLAASILYQDSDV